MPDLPSELCPACKGEGFRLSKQAGRVLRKWRQDAGVSVAGMTRQLGLSRIQVVCDWESGRNRVPLDIPERWIKVCQEKGRPGWYAK